VCQSDELKFKVTGWKMFIFQLKVKAKLENHFRQCGRKADLNLKLFINNTIYKVVNTALSGTRDCVVVAITVISASLFITRV